MTMVGSGDGALESIERNEVVAHTQTRCYGNRVKRYTYTRIAHERWDGDGGAVGNAFRLQLGADRVLGRS